ncbi:flowering time control protein FPA-like isoform X1 [Rhododendron vialii]|uniref:flowering time control protein FPA-like isoform X1 n=1 Tax=Rhododendron vialii TaxID=182163 RepID=UPI00265F66C0|nr:flowering time control protein FPA-like isoform X1 [Rhododendron vialii]
MLNRTRNFGSYRGQLLGQNRPSRVSKHCIEAMGFTVVYFLPDSEEDFVSHTEFLQYLGKNKRAEIAIFDEWTALFLVPPSNFLSKANAVDALLKGASCKDCLE